MPAVTSATARSPLGTAEAADVDAPGSRCRRVGHPAERARLRRGRVEWSGQRPERGRTRMNGVNDSSRRGE
jgi:hypothetical protein